MWFDKVNFKGNYWIRFCKVTNKFVLKNKTDFISEKNESNSCEIHPAVQNANKKAYDKGYRNFSA